MYDLFLGRLSSSPVVRLPTRHADVIVYIPTGQIELRHFFVDQHRLCRTYNEIEALGRSCYILWSGLANTRKRVTEISRSAISKQTEAEGNRYSVKGDIFCSSVFRSPVVFLRYPSYHINVAPGSFGKRTTAVAVETATCCTGSFLVSREAPSSNRIIKPMMSLRTKRRYASRDKVSLGKAAKIDPWQPFVISLSVQH